MNKLHCLIFILILQVSCFGNKTTADLQKVYGQQMTLPEGGQWRVLNRDTTYIVGSDKPKILVYYNSQGCTSCRLKELAEWKGLIDEIKTLPADTSNVEFLFVFATGKDLQSLTISLQQYGLKHPVLCDVEKSFEAQNLLPDKEIFHYFLLDRNNKACLVGSPLHNPTMWQLYKRRIAEMNSGS
ncbi:hypothetical protein BN938_2670 [Mucinivorans hirudinis]|uniref:Thioredoxin domain-containing protein n=1 Tax=Mucinivorans hirudinis TaxID=1433126 RepID=A0A060REJ5_9BACT|nr:hypothetical protein BN938_2670 [Mucinivorans hirudinis]